MTLPIFGDLALALMVCQRASGGSQKTFEAMYWSRSPAARNRMELSNPPSVKSRYKKGHKDADRWQLGDETPREKAGWIAHMLFQWPSGNDWTL
jgi:hypothetical protein